MKTKKCPNEACGKELGWTARKCECGQTFGKAAATAPKPKKTGRPKKRIAKTGKLPVPPAQSQPADDFRCCLFHDGAVGIRNAEGAIELKPDHAIELATFFQLYFTERVESARD